METLVAVCFITLTACSALDPNVGPLYVPPPFVSDAAVGSDVETDGDDDSTGTVSFARDIRQILMRTREQATAQGVARGCAPCHLRDRTGSTGTSLSGFDITSLGEMRKGGGTTVSRIIVPGKPNESEILKVLRGQYASAARMPKGGPDALYWKEDGEEMRLLTTWILEGAKGKANE